MIEETTYDVKKLYEEKGKVILLDGGWSSDPMYDFYIEVKVCDRYRIPYKYFPVPAISVSKNNKVIISSKFTDDSLGNVPSDYAKIIAEFDETLQYYVYIKDPIVAFMYASLAAQPR